MVNKMRLEEKLAEEYKYKPFKGAIKELIRSIYTEETLKLGFNLDGEDDVIIISPSGVKISNGYKRIVIGDYGAFLEIERTALFPDSIKVQSGQEYRINDPRFKDTVKYVWLTTKDSHSIKIYLQKKEVDYADYKVGMIYVSPYEIKKIRKETA